MTGSGSNKRPNEEVTNADLALLITALTDKVNSSIESNLRQFERADFRLCELERETNKKGIIITGIKPAEGENLVNIVIKLGETVGVEIEEWDIDDIWRVGKNKEIIKVVFLRSIAKRFLVQKIREKKDLTANQIGFDYNDKVFVNEALGPAASKIFARARELKRAKKINQVWTSAGRIFYKLKEGDNPRRCTTLNELALLESGPNTAGAKELEIIEKARSLRSGQQAAKLQRK